MAGGETPRHSASEIWILRYLPPRTRPFISFGYLQPVLTTPHLGSYQSDKDADWTADPVLRLKGESHLEHYRHFHFRWGIGLAS